jgi:hypothetical protein
MIERQGFAKLPPSSNSTVQHYLVCARVCERELLKEGAKAERPGRLHTASGIVLLSNQGHEFRELRDQ